MLWILGALLAALGLYVFLSRRSLSSWMIGAQLIFLSLATFFVQTGGEKAESRLGALYVVILGAVFVAVILGLSVRQFFLVKQARVDEGEGEVE